MSIIKYGISAALRVHGSLAVAVRELKKKELEPKDLDAALYRGIRATLDS